MTVTIASDEAVIRARQEARQVAEGLGFRVTDVTRIVTAVSELAHNVYLYAGEGEMRWREVRQAGKTGVEFVFDDDGPGIDDVEGALEGEYSTSNGMGRGISGTKQLMDDIDIVSSTDEGTTIRIVMWL